MFASVLLLMLLSAEEKPSPEARALAFLAKEVPAWSPEHKCFSCHNNGDAARALYTAIRLKQPLPAKVLDDTNRWLADPGRWDKNGGEGPFNDRKLARIQFAAALVEALDAGQVKDAQPLKRAAELVAELQDRDGSWDVGAEGGGLGQPATYGPYLSTIMARRTLARADARHYEKAIARADDWLSRARVESHMDAAAVLMGLEGIDTEPARKQRRHALDLLLRGQARDGGWGPYASSPPEAFDTALALLALARQPADAEMAKRIERGRAYLISIQEPDGSWHPTTRPPGADSYAERLSTSGWASLALLLTGR